MDDEGFLGSWAEAAELKDWSVRGVWESRTSHFIHLEGSGGPCGDVLVRCEKARTPGRLPALYQVYVWAHGGLARQTSLVSVPAPIDYHEASNALILAYVSGTTTKEVLRDAITSGNRDVLEAILTRCGLALAAFHCLPPPDGLPAWERQRDGRSKASLKSCIRYGDFSPNNLLLADQKAYLIDLPAHLRMAPPSRDLASFVFRLRRLVATVPVEHRDWGSASELSAWVVDRFVAAYAEESAVAFSQLRREVLHEESRRALTMARKRWRHRRLSSAGSYLVWATACFFGRHPRARSTLL